MPDKIFHHEDWQGVSYEKFLQEYAFKGGLQKLPQMPTHADVAPILKAYINEGRWIAECPEGCGNAVVCSQDAPFYICVSPMYQCPEPRKWYRVEFPEEKKRIEELLLKRLAKRPFYASTRHWLPGETVASLRRENVLRGID